MERVNGAKIGSYSGSEKVYILLMLQIEDSESSGFHLETENRFTPFPPPTKIVVCSSSALLFVINMDTEQTASLIRFNVFVFMFKVCFWTDQIYFS